jgi:hypothetical protein
MQNGFCESLNGRMGDELLNETLFFGLDHARTRITDWANDYNDRRPHTALGYLTPALVPPISMQRAIGCATRTSSADHSLLHAHLTA